MYYLVRDAGGAQGGFAQQEISIESDSENPRLFLDGQKECALEPEDRVAIRVNPDKALLVPSFL